MKYIYKVFYVFYILNLIFIPVYSQDNNDIIPNGYNKFYFDNGKVSSEGNLISGKPEGYWKTYFESGQLKSEGDRLDFELHGNWIFYTAEGFVKDEITYLGGKKNGVSKKYDIEGRLSIVSYYKSDVKDSIETTYYPNGNVHTEIPFVNGLEEGTGYEYDSIDGRIITIYKFKAGYLRSKQKINRNDNAGRKQGKWLVFYDNGILRTEGYYKNGKRNGVFKEYDKNGSLKEINKFDEDIPDLEAQETVILDIRSTYYEDGTINTTGTYKEGKKEGTHRVYDKQGNIIDGFIYKDGKVIRKGIVDESGLYQKNWEFYFVNGEVKLKGEFVNSKKQGTWMYFYKTGKKKQVGKFKNGKASGSWYWYFKNGVIHREESYLRGREDGLSVEYDEDEVIITQGEYIDGFKEGEWFYKVGDTEERGSYREDLKHGKWVYKYDNGKINFKGSYTNGQPHGKHKYYFINGSIKQQGKYKFGFKDGIWKTYDENGNVDITIKYKRGIDIKIDGVKVKPETLPNDDLEEY